MAQKQMFRKSDLGNTKKARNWFFTLNNYSKLDLEQLLALRRKANLKQFCFQEEKSKSGTQHLQGVIAFKNAISFYSMRRLLPRAHWEKCISLKASLRYCSKKETRCGELYTHNYTPFNDGKRLTDVDIMSDLLARRRASLDSE